MAAAALCVCKMCNAFFFSLARGLRRVGVYIRGWYCVIELIKWGLRCKFNCIFGVRVVHAFIGMGVNELYINEVEV